MSKETRLASLLLASAAVLMLAIPSAIAQDNGPYGPPPGYEAGPPPPPEGVEVIAPHFRNQPRAPGVEVLPGTVSLSTRVSYSDLDLRTRRGARELRLRVRAAAANVCDQLARAYPYQQLPLSNCYRDAVSGGLGMAAARTDDVRVQARQRGEYIFSD